MSLPRTPRLALIVLIVALLLAALVGGPGPVSAEAASQRSGSSQAASHTKTSAKHKAKKSKKKSKCSKKKNKKAKCKKAKKSKKTKKAAKAKKATISKPRKATPAPKTAANSRYVYNTLRQRYTFGGTKLDQSRWGVYNTNGWWSKDRDARRPELVTVANNTLRVGTTGTKGSGLCLCKKSAKPTKPYGRYEIRAKAQANRDHGFAMLLWPTAEDWPAGGEIDIAEFDHARTKLWTTLHYHPKHKRYISHTKGNYTTWHTYGVEWTPKAVTWFLDGKPVMKVSDPAAIPRRAMQLAIQAGKMNGVKSPSNTSAMLEIAWINQYG